MPSLGAMDEAQPTGGFPVEVSRADAVKGDLLTRERTMCNAWNHAIGCDCGWGGYHEHAAVATSMCSYHDWCVRFFRQEECGFTNPNARCPVCRLPVFFYQSPEGGRVFFDSLGPPWPKHECTDSRDARVPRVYAWHQAGWRPFLVLRSTGTAAPVRAVRGLGLTRLRCHPLRAP